LPLSSRSMNELVGGSTKRRIHTGSQLARIAAQASAATQWIGRKREGRFFERRRMGRSVLKAWLCCLTQRGWASSVVNQKYVT
jgi:hypothetical protein